ncbi:hypothetical protein BCR33DRAFT_471506 [Rhizoclosmatium globosum]|uniref:Uncharacterized protein n=1 Tax=Rhizoclosmatium globosum TaxID=329046 RepID=A0A1Y2BQ08_9FUNG|nr:hypothetical protein BCR33DRAFT_471506 [Rhizoclosmatium globosum]|eukprot:ORY36838.1 hypothetical protein BCR33DRAFT_471506 [Rhizoclosmatium globosum]
MQARQLNLLWLCHHLPLLPLSQPRHLQLQQRLHLLQPQLSQPPNQLLRQQLKPLLHHHPQRLLLSQLLWFLQLLSPLLNQLLQQLKLPPRHHHLPCLLSLSHL